MPYPVLSEEEHSWVLQYPWTVPVKIMNSLSCEAANCFFAVFGEKCLVDTLSMVWSKLVIGDPAQDDVVKMRNIDDLPIFQSICWACTEPCKTSLTCMLSVQCFPRSACTVFILALIQQMIKRQTMSISLKGTH